MLFNNVLTFEYWGSHTYTDPLGFVRARDSAPVIIGKHNDWFIIYGWMKYFLAGNIKTVAVNKGKNFRQSG
jgi:hypothetical protein